MEYTSISKLVKRNGTGGKNQPESPAQLTLQVDPAQGAERIYGCTSRSEQGDGDPFKVEMELFGLDCPFQMRGRKCLALWIQLFCYSSVFQIKRFSGCSILC